jgi:hypothetical protein
MPRFLIPSFATAALVTLTSCSSVSVYNVQKKDVRITQRPTQIFVAPFAAPLRAFQLGERTPAEKSVLRDEIVRNLAHSTAGQLRIHAARASVIRDFQQLTPGSWLVRGEILKVDQGSRALRAVIGLGAGRTAMRTRVTVYGVTSVGLVPLIRFNTTGASGMEPGVALGVATGGVGTAVSAASAAGSLLMSSLPGVSSDIDRTSYEIAAVVSVYLQNNGLLESSRTAITPNMRGQLPTTVNLNRAVPAPLRSTD